jgi:cytochrome c oxidase subunit 3
MEMNEQKKRIHPYKFTLWVGMGSIVMMFAGLTSAYIVKRNQVNWQGFDLPVIFKYSTAVIILSSITMQLSLRNFRNRHMKTYKQLMLVTAILGAAFISMQWMGFQAVNEGGIKLIGQGSNVAGSFLAVIAGVHMVHVLGGIIALLIILLKAVMSRTRNYSAIPVEVLSTYWHFVDILWIYLFVFLSTVN